MSDTERYQEEAKNMILEKCKEIYKDKKLNSLNESIINSLLTILDLIRTEEEGDSGVGTKEIISQKKSVEAQRQLINNYKIEYRGKKK